MEPLAKLIAMLTRRSARMRSSPPRRRDRCYLVTPACAGVACAPAVGGALGGEREVILLGLKTRSGSIERWSEPIVRLAVPSNCVVMAGVIDRVAARRGWVVLPIAGLIATKITSQSQMQVNTPTWGSAGITSFAGNPMSGKL